MSYVLDKFCTATLEFHNIYKHFYAQILMYLIIQVCFYMCVIDVQSLPEDDQDR